MCHAFVSDSRFYQFLFHIDQDIANEAQLEGCAHCGDKLHVASYPRKPRGIRCALDESYELRLSFCCTREVPQYNEIRLIALVKILSTEYSTSFRGN